MHRRESCLLLCLWLFVPPVHAQTPTAAAVPKASKVTVPDVSPQIFAPGVISGPANDGAPAFSPDGNTIFFTRSGATWAVILESQRAGDHWSEPQIASFSGEWNDQQPAMSPDGSFIVFISSRPAPPSQEPSNTGTTPLRAFGIWQVKRAGTGWGQPVRLPDTVNFCPLIFKPSVAADSNIYFMAMEKGKKFRLFRSQYQGGVYRKAEPLSFSDGTAGDVDPEIAPDESFLLFSSDGRRPDDTAHEHLFIVFKKAGAWGTVVPIRYAGDDLRGSSNDNESHLSPDRRTLYFSSDRTLPVHFPRTREQATQDIQRLQSWDNGNYNVWFMPVAPWLNLANTGETT